MRLNKVAPEAPQVVSLAIRPWTVFGQAFDPDHDKVVCICPGKCHGFRLRLAVAIRVPLAATRPTPFPAAHAPARRPAASRTSPLARLLSPGHDDFSWGGRGATFMRRVVLYSTSKQQCLTGRQPCQTTPYDPIATGTHSRNTAFPSLVLTCTTAKPRNASPPRVGRY